MNVEIAGDCVSVIAHFHWTEIKKAMRDLSCFVLFCFVLGIMWARPMGYCDYVFSCRELYRQLRVEKKAISIRPYNDKHQQLDFFFCCFLILLLLNIQHTHALTWVRKRYPRNYFPKIHIIIYSVWKRIPFPKFMRENMLVSEERRLYNW